VFGALLIMIWEFAFFVRRWRAKNTPVVLESPDSTSKKFVAVV
jgi:hypothetical protein